MTHEPPTSSAKTRYSLVIPVLNEQAVLPALIARIDALMARLDGPTEAIFVDDGSTDQTAAILELKTRTDSRYRLIELSRNFGHQAAITAGMDAAMGDAVVVMDADLQDPPEVALDLAHRPDGRRATKLSTPSALRARASPIQAVDGAPFLRWPSPAGVG